MNGASRGIGASHLVRDMREGRLHASRRDVLVPRRQREVIDLADVEGLGDLLLVGASVVAAATSARIIIAKSL